MISQRGNQEPRKKKRENFCGGTLIGSSAVVTAAHCVFDMENRKDLFVRLGAIYNDGKEHGYVKEYDIKEVRNIPRIQNMYS